MSKPIIEEMKEFANDVTDFTAYPLKNPDNKGLARSAFQKAIRRGQVDRALRMGGYLLDFDEGYAWRTLATVLIEDVGIGDLDLVSYGTITTLKTIRDEIGDRQVSHNLFASMVTFACRGVKSQACCEVSLWLDTKSHDGTKEIEETAHDPEESHAPPHEILMERMKSTVIGRSYLASCRLRKSLRGMGSEALIPALEFIQANLDDFTEARACMMSFERTVDTMNLALFPIVYNLNLTGEHVDGVLEESTWPEEIIIKSVSSAALDMHTAIGSRAIAAFFNKLKKEYDWAEELYEQVTKDPENKPTKALGSFVFIAEGGLVDVRCTSPLLHYVRRKQHKWFPHRYGVPKETVFDIDKYGVVLEGVRNNIPMLNELRQWSASK